MRRLGLFGMALTGLAVLLFSGCDLLNNKPEIDVERVIDDKIAWANAEQLTVTVEYLTDWGYSPQRGTGKAGDTRRGFAFTVEFTPAAEYGFEKWIAVKNRDYNANNPGATDTSKDLNGNGVSITESRSDTGAWIASVTIDITEGITLIPLCFDRPRIRESNPPLTATANSFPYDQKISLVFNMAIRDVQLGLEGSIRMNAIRTSGVSDVGDISEYFTASLEEDDTRIDLTVKNDAGHPATDLAQLVITVTVGPGIEGRREDGRAGLTMASAQTLTYITGGEAAQKVYAAGNVQAARAAGGPYFQNSGTDWRDYTIDRRFNKTNTKTAYIKFTAQNPADELRPPNRFTVVERLYLDLGSFPLSGSTEKQYVLTDTKVSQAGSFYTIAHELQTTDPGIIQLIVLPWLDGASGYPAADPMTVLSTTPPQYVTVVLDTAAPGLNNPEAVLSGHATEAEGLYTYGENSTLTLTVGRMDYLSDNATAGGIADSEATGKPWTKDRFSDLRWRVVFESASNPKRHESAWQNATENTYTLNTQTLFTGGTLDTETAYDLKLQFADRMENISASQPTDLSVQYSSQAAMITNLAGLKALRDTVNGGGITAGKAYILTADITLSGPWTPIGTDANPFAGKFDGNGHTISGLDLDDSVAYTGLFGCVEDAEIRDLRIDVNTAINSETVTRIGGIAGYAKGSTRIENCTSAGTLSLLSSSSSGAVYAGGFAGFIDSGVSIRNVSGGLNLTLTNTSNYANVYAGGVAGCVGSAVPSETVNIDGASVSGGVKLDGAVSGMIYGGGIAGANSNQKGTMKDIEYSGRLEVYRTNYGTGYSQGYIGGIVGETASNIENASFTGTMEMPAGFYAYNTAGDTDVACFGGIVGRYKLVSGVSSVSMTDSSVRGNLSVYRTGLSGKLNVGGLVGFIEGHSSLITITLKNCRVETGDITVTSASKAQLRVGGCFGGILQYAVFDNVRSEGGLLTLNKDALGGSVSPLSYIGGFAGTLENSDLRDCYSKTNIITSETVPGNDSFIGGFIGSFINNTDPPSGSELTDCFATGTITASSTGSLFIGGLIGKSDGPGTRTVTRAYATGSVTGTMTGSPNGADFYAGGLIGNAERTTISQTYATGSVTAITSNDTTPVYAGGLVGVLGYVGDTPADIIRRESSITDSYALGDVLANASGNSVYAGGLVGQVFITDGKEVTRNFAAGSVTAQSAGNSASMYAGGIVGYKNTASGYNGTLSFNAALGAKIVATGGSGRNAARVYAYGAGTNNYALNSMLTGTAATYDAYVAGIPISSNDASSADGYDEGIGTFRTQSFWTTTGLLFDSTVWDFTYLAAKGYPRLIGEEAWGGQ